MRGDLEPRRARIARAEQRSRRRAEVQLELRAAAGPVEGLAEDREIGVAAGRPWLRADQL